MLQLALAYFTGARRFDVFDLNTNTIRSSPLDREGNVEFYCQELLSHVDKISGRLAGTDLGPKVYRGGRSLASIRERSVAQIISDAVVDSTQLEAVKTTFAHVFTAMGLCGIQGHVIDHPTIGLTADLEVVYPTELMPFPSLGTDYTKQRGLMRQRWVPFDLLQDRYGRRVTSHHDEMEVWRKQIGAPVDGGSWTGEMAEPFLTYRQETGGALDTDKTAADVALVRELWLDGEVGTVSRYILASGDYVIQDEDFSGEAVFCPIGVARFMETGSFYGAGAFHLLWSLARELEKNLKQLFNDVRDTDRYGVILLPQGVTNQNVILRDVGKGLRAAFYEFDAFGEASAPLHIKPQLLSEVPMKVSAYAKELMDRMSPVRDLIEEKGRVDSAVGLSFLDEQINQAMTNPSRGIQNGFGTLYRSVVAKASRALVESPRPLPVTRLTLDLAGAVIDADGETVSFPENPLPNVSRLQFGTRETSPRSVTARKMEAMELQKALQIGPDRFSLFAVSEGLDFAFWFEDRQAAYEAIVLDVLVLYGDGVTPGQLIGVPQTYNPEFQLMVLDRFMQSVAFRRASPEVVNEFLDYRAFLVEQTGMILPSAVPNPDDAALMRQVEMAQGAAVEEGLGPMAAGGRPQLPPAQ